ncbi:MAG: glycerophosphodiester phosphodiesterase, partial [Bradymonadia bacterium]
RVETMSWRELSAVSFSNGGSIPSLVQMRDFATPGFEMNLEIKSLRAVNPVIDFLREWDCSQWVISSFKFNALSEMQQALPLQPLGYLLECEASETFAACFERAEIQMRSLNTKRVHLDNELASSPDAQWLFEGEYLVHVWTVNDVTRGQALKTLGTQGIFTDDVRLFV